MAFAGSYPAAFNLSKTVMFLPPLERFCSALKPADVGVGIFAAAILSTGHAEPPLRVEILPNLFFILGHRTIISPAAGIERMVTPACHIRGPNRKEPCLHDVNFLCHLKCLHFVVSLQQQHGRLR
nr:MAG TPA: hypothetical protein [Caudoviricetes sp.]